jgi:cytochrome c oxidase subunit 1
MSTGATTAGHVAGADHPDHHGDYLTCDKGLRSWLFTLDHKRIGVMYLAAILFSFLLGGIFALLMRTELLTPGTTVMNADDYNRMFTLHGAIMTFLFIIPGIPAALGNFVLPLMLGAKDVALPRLNLASFHIYVIGAIMAVCSILLGGVDTGWTFYTPYSTTTNGAVILVTLSVFVLGFSSIFTGINFIVTVHKMRPAGMGWFRMPLLLWALYSTAIIQVLATPVLAITVLLLIAERALGIGIFDPALGGDPVLFQHFFWFYSHPAVYIMILPAMGVISELVSIYSRKPIFGYTAIAYSSIAIAIFSFLVWGHHMFVSGQSELAVVVFSALTFSVSIPSAVKVFNWISTMYRGSIKLETPMVYALIFIFLFGIGGLTGLFLATLSTDVHLHDTYFVVAHFHYTMMGGTMIAFLAGIYHWWPKMFGRMYSQKWGNVGAALVFLGFNGTFFAQFIMGSQGMPRRYYNYPPEFEIYHQISTYGSYILAVGLFIAGGVLLHSLLAGRKAPTNPWGAATLEWQAASPPIHHNFDGPLVLTDPYDYSGQEWDENEQGFVLARRDKETPST